MKKWIFFIAVLCLSVLLGSFSYSHVLALENGQSDTESTIETIYPKNILDYVDLDGISAFDLNNSSIAYTLDKNSITIFEKSTKKYTKINGFEGISKIKFASDLIVVADVKNVYIVDNTYSINKLNNISLLNLKAIDVYVDDTNIYIGTICDNTFSLYKYNLDLTEPKSNPIETCNSSSFENAFMMAINDKCAYIVYKTEIDNKTQKYKTGLCIKRYDKSELGIQENFNSSNGKVIDTFRYDDRDFLITFTQETFYLLSPENKIYSKVNDISSPGDLNKNYFPIFEITDTTIFDNKIYIADSHFKTIQSYTISPNEDGYDMTSSEIILGSSSFDYGRFNKPSNIFVQGDEYYISDTGNNRIQYLIDGKSHIIDNLATNANPHSISIDKFHNMYFVANENGQDYLYKYSYSYSKNNNVISHNYNFSQKYYQVNGINIGKIADIAITNSNVIFLLDISNNQILYLSGNNLVKLNTNLLNTYSLDPSSKIEYIKSLNKLVITFGNKIVALNTDGKFSGELNLDNIKGITADYDKLYAITNNEISMLKIENTTITLESKITFNSTYYSNYTYDIANRKMIAFDNNRQCINTFKLSLNPNPFAILDISDTTPLKKTSTLIPLMLTNNKLIYKYPYNLGTTYNLDGEIENVVGINEFNADYYIVLFNLNNTLQQGYIEKINTTKQDYEYKSISVMTTNQIVSVYKYPTLLKYNGERIVTGTLPINTIITLNYVYPVSIDSKTFYLYQKGNDIGFIFNADVVLNNNKTIKNLNTENATIKVIGEESTYLLEEDKETVIKTLKNGERIFVESYDKNSKYTKVIIKDTNLNTYTGYVLTSDIEMDKLDSSKIVLIIIIVISTLLLAGIITFYIVLKKRNK